MAPWTANERSSDRDSLFAYRCALHTSALRTSFTGRIGKSQTSRIINRSPLSSVTSKRHNSSPGSSTSLNRTWSPTVKQRQLSKGERHVSHSLSRPAWSFMACSIPNLLECLCLRSVILHRLPIALAANDKFRPLCHAAVPYAPRYTTVVHLSRSLAEKTNRMRSTSCRTLKLLLRWSRPPSYVIFS